MNSLFFTPFHLRIEPLKSSSFQETTQNIVLLLEDKVCWWLEQELDQLNQILSKFKTNFQVHLRFRIHKRLIKISYKFSMGFLHFIFLLYELTIVTQSRLHSVRLQFMDNKHKLQLSTVISEYLNPEIIYTKTSFILTEEVT